MNDDIAVSIIVPVYKTENYIRDCVASILDQTIENFEVIFVDDGSDDSCPQICDEYCEKDSRFKVIHKQNAGLGLARNSGMELVRGRYFTFLDSDDWIDNNHLQTLLQGTQNGIMDVVIAGCKHCDDNQQIGQSPLYMIGDFDENTIRDSVILPIIAPNQGDTSELSIPMSVCFNLYRTSIMKENNLAFLSERDTVGEDLFFNLKFLSLCSRINCIEWYGYNYRININSISRKYNPERLKRTENYYHYLTEYIKDLGIDTVIGYRAERSTLSKFRAALRLAANSSDIFAKRYVECKRILDSSVLQKILRVYPINTFRSSVMMVSFFMKHKFTLLTMMMFKVEKILRKK